MIAAVLWDLGGVLCRFRPERRLEQLSRLTGQPPARVVEVLQRGLLDALDIGAVGRQELGEVVRLELEWNGPYEMLAGAWAGAFEPKPDVLALVGRVRVRRGLLSDNGAPLADLFPALLPEVAGVIDPAIFSSDLGCTKPAREAFEAACLQLNAPPARVLFVDDNPANVAGARAAGLHALHFTTTDALEAALRRHRVLDEATGPVVVGIVTNRGTDRPPDLPQGTDARRESTTPPCAIRQASATEHGVIRGLLTAADLSPRGVGAPGATYWLAETDIGPVGVAGLEWAPEAALLRSVAILLGWRGRGWGGQLVAIALAEAHRRQRRAVYLFSTDAASFWTHLGFVEITPTEAAAAVPDTTQVIEYRTTGTLCCERAWRLALPAREPTVRGDRRRLLRAAPLFHAECNPTDSPVCVRR